MPRATVDVANASRCQVRVRLVPSKEPEIFFTPEGSLMQEMSVREYQLQRPMLPDALRRKSRLALLETRLLEMRLKKAGKRLTWWGHLYVMTAQLNAFFMAAYLFILGKLGPLLAIGNK